VKLLTGIEAKDFSSLAQKNDIVSMNTSLETMNGIVDQLHSKLGYIVKG